MVYTVCVYIYIYSCLYSRTYAYTRTHVYAAAAIEAVCASLYDSYICTNTHAYTYTHVYAAVEAGIKNYIYIYKSISMSANIQIYTLLDTNVRTYALLLLRRWVSRTIIISIHEHMYL